MTHISFKRNELLGRYFTTAIDARGQWLGPEDIEVMRDLFRVLFHGKGGRTRSVLKQVGILDWLAKKPLWQISLAAYKFFEKEVQENVKISAPYERYFFGIVRGCEGEYLDILEKRDTDAELARSRRSTNGPGDDTTKDQRATSGFHNIGDILSDLPEM